MRAEECIHPLSKSKGGEGGLIHPLSVKPPTILYTTLDNVYTHLKLQPQKNSFSKI